MASSSEPFAPASRWDQEPGQAAVPSIEAEPVRRLTEIEEFTNLHGIHPIASRLAQALRDTPVSPNAVSLTGMLCGVLAGIGYFHYRDWRCTVAGFVLMAGWHVMDGADGQLARLKHAQSEIGRVLDGVCDYVTFAAVYGALAIRLAAQHGNFVWLLVAAAGVCHAVQASAYEAQRQEFEFWGCGRASKNILKPELPPAPGTVSRAGRWSRLLDGLYGKVQFAAIGSTITFHRRLEARLATGADTEAFRSRYRSVFAPTVRRWSVLSANYRTIGIFLCTVVGAPMVYFPLEILGFSFVLAILSYRLRPLQAQFLADTDVAGAVAA